MLEAYVQHKNIHLYLKSKDEKLRQKQTRKQPKIVRNYLTLCRIEKDIKIMWKKNYLFLMINFIDKSLTFFFLMTGEINNVLKVKHELLTLTSLYSVLTLSCSICYRR